MLFVKNAVFSDQFLPSFHLSFKVMSDNLLRRSEKKLEIILEDPAD